MKVKRLLDELKEYYNSIPWIGLEAIDSTPAFSKLDNCAFFAAIKTLTTEELKEARQILFHDKYPSVLLYIIDECLNPKPYNIYNKNETIDTLIKRFLDKKSKRVIESRKELQSRFDRLSFADQKKIIKAFLASPPEISARNYGEGVITEVKEEVRLANERSARKKSLIDDIMKEV